MAIVGGGVFTPIMGLVSDVAGSIALAEIVPALCFVMVFVFARFRAQPVALAAD